MTLAMVLAILFEVISPRIVSLTLAGLQLRSRAMSVGDEPALYRSALMSAQCIGVRPPLVAAWQGCRFLGTFADICRLHGGSMGPFVPLVKQVSELL